MPAEDSEDVWPPPPGSGYEPPVKMYNFRWMLGWIGPMLSGVAGAIAGAILLPVILLVLIYFTNDAGSPMGFLFAMVVAAALGAGVGFVFGIVAWFIGKGLLGWWRRSRSKYSVL